MMDEAVTMTAIALAESGGSSRQGSSMSMWTWHEAARNSGDGSDIAVNPSSFQIISAGSTEAGSRLFVGNLTMHSEASNIVPEPMDEVLVGFGNSDIAHPDFLWLPRAAGTGDGSDIAFYSNYTSDGGTAGFPPSRLTTMLVNSAETTGAPDPSLDGNLLLF